MRKEKLVTRTFKTTTFTAIGIFNGAIEERIITIVGDMNDAECKTRAEKIFTDGFMVAGVKDLIKGEKLYGMTESVFLANAKELPLRTKETEETEDA